MRYDHNQNEPVGISTVEIRIPVKKGDQEKGPSELFEETARALKDQCNLDKDRPRLLQCKSENGVLLLEYEILRKQKSTI